MSINQKISNLVTVVIPAYNSAVYLNECVESVEGQTYQQIEIIIIDDGSTDNTYDVVKELQKKYSNIIYKKIENSKSPTARNVGIGLASGEFISAIDADDIWPSDKLETQVAQLRKNPDAVILGKVESFTMEDGVKKWRRVVRAPDIDSNAIYHEEILKMHMDQMVVFNTFMARTEIIQRYGLWNPEFITGHDWENWIRLSKKFQFIHIDKVFQYYRKHSSSTTRGEIRYRGLTYQLRVIERHSPIGFFGLLKQLEYKRVRYDSWIRIYVYESKYKEAFKLLVKSLVNSNVLFSIAGLKLIAETLLKATKYLFKRKEASVQD